VIEQSWERCDEGSTDIAAQRLSRGGLVVSVADQLVEELLCVRIDHRSLFRIERRYSL